MRSLQASPDNSPVTRARIFRLPANGRIDPRDIIATGPIPLDADDLAFDCETAQRWATRRADLAATLAALPIFGGSLPADREHQGDDTGPFRRGAPRYRPVGLAGVFPLPERRKSPPMTDYTGRNGKCVDDAKLTEWLADPKHQRANIGVWLGVPVIVNGTKYQVVGIDVDHYTSGRGDSARVKTGGDQLAALADQLGPLPQTWISSARTDGKSGIRFYLAAHGIEFVGKADKDIEVIQRKHRFAVVWPSEHPGDDEIPPGQTYWWFPPGVPLTEAGRKRWNPDTNDLPNVADLPMLPDAWIVYLTEHRSHSDDTDWTVSVPKLFRWAEDTFRSGDADDMCWNVANALATYKRQISDEATSHDKITDAHWMLYRLAAEGHTGWKDAVSEIEAHWTDDVIARDKRSRAELRSEIFRSATGALRKIKPRVEREPVPDFCKCAGSSLTVGPGQRAGQWHSHTVPLAAAEQYALAHERDERPIHRWRGDWYQYIGTRWKTLGDDEFNGSLYSTFRAAKCWNKAANELVPWNPDETKIRKVSHALRSVVLLDGEDISAPCWLDGTDEHVIAFGNCLLRVADRKQIDHTPKFFNTAVLPFDYDPAAPTPARWLQFLGEVFPDDPDAIAALQEWFGYVVSGRTDLHKMLMLIGPRRSGKSTIVYVLKALVGNENHTETRTSDIVGSFGLEGLIGKTLAVFDDDRITGSAKKFVDLLKNIIGEGEQSVNRKYKTPWKGQLPARFVYVANELSALPDSSGAIVSRMLPIETTVSFEANPDRGLRRKLDAELAGIFNWALDGLDRLNDADRGNEFTEPESSRSLLDEIDNMASPVTQFIDETCVFNADEFVADDDLYQLWRAWCASDGLVAGSKKLFMAKIRAAYGKKIEPGKRGSRGEQKRSFVGIELRPEAQERLRPATSGLVNIDADRWPVRGSHE